MQRVAEDFALKRSSFKLLSPRHQLDLRQVKFFRLVSPSKVLNLRASQRYTRRVLTFSMLRTIPPRAEPPLLTELQCCEDPTLRTDYQIQNPCCQATYSAPTDYDIDKIRYQHYIRCHTVGKSDAYEVLQVCHHCTAEPYDVNRPNSNCRNNTT